MTEPRRSSSATPDSAANAAGDASSAASADPARHLGLVLTAAVFAAVSAVAAMGYGFAADLLSVKALAFQSLLAAAAFWLTLHAMRVRRRLVEGRREAAPAPPLRPPSAGGGWGDRPEQLRGWAEPIEDQRRRDAPLDLPDVDVVRGQHHFLLAAVTALGVLLPVGVLLYRHWAAAGPELSTAAATAIAVVLLAASCLWLVLARTLAGIEADELPEAPGLALAARESHWLTVLVPAGVIAALVWPAAEHWMGVALLCWTALAACEQIVRVVVARWRHTESAELIEPIALTSRQWVFVRGNPLASALANLEERLGVSFRSSWAIRFVRAAMLPSAVMVLLLFWGLTSIAVVQIDELGVRETLGRRDARPLPPGLHWKLPWPFARVVGYPVKRISTVPVGFTPLKEGEVPGYLWSVPHAEEEFALLLGDGTEVVAVNVMVYYKIREDDEGFFDYVYHFQNPAAALEAYAYQALTLQTVDKRMTSDRPLEEISAAVRRAFSPGAAAEEENEQEDEVAAAEGPAAGAADPKDIFAGNRAEFADRLRDALRRFVAENRLGLEVIEVAVINMHPPVDAADDYLDVISAAIDRERLVVEAEGETRVHLQDAARETTQIVAAARIEAAQRVGAAVEQSAEFAAVGRALAVSGEALKRRLWLETLEQVLPAKRVFLLDRSFTVGPGETLLDLRPDRSEPADAESTLRGRRN